MQRRGESVRPAKTRRTPGPKARKASKLSTAEFQEQVAALRHDLKEAREQQTATTEVLKVIASSPGKLQPVFNSMLENATRICAANFGLMYLYDSDYWRPVAQLHVPPKFSEWLLAERRSWGPETGLGRIAKSKQLVQIVDVKADRLYVQKDPSRVAFVELAGARTFRRAPDRILQRSFDDLYGDCNDVRICRLLSGRQIAAAPCRRSPVSHSIVVFDFDGS